MIYSSILFSSISVLTFTLILIMTYNSKIDNLQKFNMAGYLFLLLVWQAASLLILLSDDPAVIRILYYIYYSASAGFICSITALSYSILGHPRKKPVTIFSLALFIILTAHIIYFNAIVSVYPGQNGYYLAEVDMLMLQLYTIPLLLFGTGIILSFRFLRRTDSAVSRHRYYYVLFAALIILAGLASDMTRLRSYPLDILSALLGGFILAYSVLRKRLLNFRKTFFRGSLQATLIAAAAGLFILLLYITFALLQRPVPHIVILPAVLTFTILLLLKPNRKPILSKLVMPSSSIYAGKLEDYENLMSRLQAFTPIFELFHTLFVSEYGLNWFVIHLIDIDDGDLSIIYADPIPHKASISMRIPTEHPLLAALKDRGILICSEHPAELFSDIYGGAVPDIILPIQIANEVIGFSSISIQNYDRLYLDNEDLDFIIKVNGYTVNAVTRAYAFEQLEREVYKKENLIKDINHRVKNNLQMISGLLVMQGMSSEDTHVIEALQTAEQRIFTIAKIHEMLYIKGLVDMVSLKNYVSEVIESHRDSTPQPISFLVEVDEILVDAEKAVTICMIVNELVSNAVKYAFEGRSPGTVSVRIEDTGDGILHCIISDNGKGLPENSPGPGIGHKLVKSFIKKQLKGEWEIINGEGTEHRLIIPLLTP